MAAGGLWVRKIKRLIFRKYKSRLATGFCEPFHLLLVHNAVFLVFKGIAVHAD